MAAHGGLRQAQHVAELLDRERLALQEPEQAEPGLVGEPVHPAEQGGGAGGAGGGGRGGAGGGAGGGFIALSGWTDTTITGRDQAVRPAGAGAM